MGDIPGQKDIVCLKCGIPPRKKGWKGGLSSKRVEFDRQVTPEEKM